jgi:hypothetical protein
MANPKVSIVVPVFKTPIALLQRSLHSILDQTLADIELVAVDDASPDDCPQVLDDIAATDERLTVIHRAENGRAGAARNQGLEVAQGEFVLFADADDCLGPDACSRLVALAGDHQADIVACSWTDVDGAGQTLRTHALADRVYELSRKVDRSRCFHSITYALWNKLFRREVLGDLRFESFEANIGEDTLFNVSALCRCRRMVTTSYSGYQYTVHGSSATGRSAKGMAYLETISRSQQAIAETLAATGIAHDRTYADWLALKRYVTGCEWIAENRDVAERAELWEYWRFVLDRDLVPSMGSHMVMARVFRLLAECGSVHMVARWMRRVTRARDRARSMLTATAGRGY